MLSIKMASHFEIIGEELSDFRPTENLQVLQIDV